MTDKPIDGAEPLIHIYPAAGIELRDYFAAQAMAIYARTDDGKGYETRDDIARWAYQLADAMLAERRAQEGANR